MQDASTGKRMAGMCSEASIANSASTHPGAMMPLPGISDGSVRSMTCLCSNSLDPQVHDDCMQADQASMPQMAGPSHRQPPFPAPTPPRECPSCPVATLLQNQPYGRCFHRRTHGRRTLKIDGTSGKCRLARNLPQAARLPLSPVPLPAASLPWSSAGASAPVTACWSTRPPAPWAWQPRASPCIAALRCAHWVHAPRQQITPRQRACMRPGRPCLWKSHARMVRTAHRERKTTLPVLHAVNL